MPPLEGVRRFAVSLRANVIDLAKDFRRANRCGQTAAAITGRDKFRED